jgi:ATP dependent DNA ligase domain
MSTTLFTGGQTFGSGLRDARLTDAAMLEMLQVYKRRVAGNYRALPPARLGELSAAKMWVSRKVDGETWFLVHQSGHVFLASPTGRVLAGDLPILKQAAKLPEASIVAGELYAITAERRERVGDLAAALARDGADAAKGIAFMAFDAIQLAGQPLPIAYEEKIQALKGCLANDTHLQVVETQEMKTGLEVFQHFESQVLPSGSEGLVVRHANGMIYKVKPEISLDAVAIGYTVKADQPKLCRSLLLAMRTTDGTYVIVGACGNLGDDAQRSAWFERLQGLSAPSQIRRASDSGGLYQFVKPSWVAEFSVTDLQGELSDGTQPMAQTGTFTEAGWARSGSMASASLIHPVFKRLREDKTPDETGVRFAQLQDYMPLTPNMSPALALPPSTLVRREVWTKTTKGQLAVRKLLVWQTNKSAQDDRYPAFVVHWTDYSAGRAEPLDRDVRPAPDETTAQAIAQEFIDANIKKGWEKVGL